MKEMPRLIIVLTAIALISGLVLAFTYDMTTDQIKKNAELKKQRAITEVLPGLETYQLQKKGDFSYFQGYDQNNDPLGVAVEASGSGFQGQIKLMIGFDVNEKKITGIKILEHLETPGLGAKITEKDFKANFQSKPFAEYTVVKRPVNNELEVEAIAGATISSNAVTTIIQDTLKILQTAFGGEV